MKGINRYAAITEFLRKVKGKQDLGEFTLAVCPRAAVMPGKHDIVKINCLLPGGRNINNATSGSRAKGGQQQAGQQKTCQVIDGEAQFIPVMALRAAGIGA